MWSEPRFEVERDGTAMLNDNELATWYQRLKLPERARKIIDQAVFGADTPRWRRALKREWALSQPEDGQDNPV